MSLHQLQTKVGCQTSEGIEVTYNIVDDPQVDVSLQSLIIIDDDLMGPSFSYSVCSINSQSHLQLRGEVEGYDGQDPQGRSYNSPSAGSVKNYY